MIGAGLVGLLAFLPQTAPGDAQRWDFERDEPGSVPADWFVPQGVQAGFGAEVVAEGAQQGANAVRIFRIEGGDGSVPFGNLMHALPVEALRGKRVRLEMALRAGPGSTAQAWMRVDRPARVVGLFDNMDDRPVRSQSWEVHRIEGSVDEDAEGVVCGFMLTAGDEAFVDSVTLEILGDRPAPVAPRALSERELANLAAFGRAYGYVRYFHPSDEVEAADWEELAFQGIERIEPAPDAAALAAALTRVFEPVAPTVQFHVTGTEVPPLPSELTDTAPEGAALRRWRHVGLGKEGRKAFDIYQSSRMRARLVDGAIPEGWSHPSDVFRADLPGGVSCSVPLVLFEQSGRTLPAAVAAAWDRPVPFEPRGDDRTTRLADVVIAWNVFQHFYPYFDVVPFDGDAPVHWPAMLDDSLRRAALDPDARAFLDTLQALVAGLADGHGRVVHGSDNRFGVLPLAWQFVGDELVVTHTSERSDPSIRPGDVVLEIDGRTVSSLLSETSRLVSGATAQWTRYRVAGDLARGVPGQACTLLVESLVTGEATRHELVHAPYDAAVREPRPETLVELEPGIWYVDIDRATTEDLERHRGDLAAATGIVWDFRGYPRGVKPGDFFPHLLDEPAQSAQWLVPVATRPDREDVTFDARGRWTLEPAEPRFGGKNVFLIDGRAISYAESCLGIIEHYRLGELVGGPTAGTNGNVNPFVLPGGYSVSWTGMKVLKHDGSRHHGVGILPTVPVERTRAGIAAGRDEILERGLEVVRGD